MIQALLKMWWLILAVVVVPTAYAYFEEKGGDCDVAQEPNARKIKKAPAK